MKLPEYFDSLACIAAKDWLESQLDPEAAWHACSRGDWLAWLLMWCEQRWLSDDPIGEGWGDARMARLGRGMVRITLPYLPYPARDEFVKWLDALEASGGDCGAGSNRFFPGRDLRGAELSAVENVSSLLAGPSWLWRYAADRMLWACHSLHGDATFGTVAPELASLIRAEFSFAEVEEAVLFADRRDGTFPGEPRGR